MTFKPVPGITQKTSLGGDATEFAPIRPIPRDPSQNNLALAQALPIRESFKIGQTMNGGAFANGVLNTSASLSPVRCSFVVASTSFTRGHVIELGPYTLLAYMHYLPVSGNVNSTATNIAAAISRLPGFSATAATATVTVTFDGGTGDTVVFRILQDTTACFSSITPSTGLMSRDDTTWRSVELDP